MILVYLLFVDFAQMERAIDVKRYVKTFCIDHKRLPNSKEIERQFGFFKEENRWYYFHNFSKNETSIQYPMTLPLPGSPGRMVISEFAPVIYANSIRIACP